MIEADSKKLILGLLSGMTLEQATPFFLSLEKSGYRGDVAMVVSGLDADTQSFLRTHGVQLIPFQTAFLLKSIGAGLARLPGFFLPGRNRLLFDRRLAPAYMHPHCARHFFYQSFLEECGLNYSHVMLTDVSDVLFQADPFAFEAPDGLSVFVEDRSHSIGSSKHNARAVLRGFGRTVLRELRDQPIICAGTTIGTTAAIREHLARVIAILLQKKERKTIDQAVHNFLIHKEPPAKLRCFENFSGPVLTMGDVNPAQLKFNDTGRILNLDGSIINTLHQYDRHPELARKLIKALA
jgi:hypothetical protein